MTTILVTTVGLQSNTRLSRQGCEENRAGPNRLRRVRPRQSFVPATLWSRLDQRGEVIDAGIAMSD
jgi:hypothetical protein